MLHKATALVVAGLISFTASAADIYFSPKGGAEAALVSEIGAAKREIRIMTYQLTNQRISDAIIAAKSRGVDVKLIVDRSQRKIDALPENQTCCAYKTAQTVPTQLDAKHAIMHNKVVIIDKYTVVTGSFNFSNAAEKSNAENMIVLRSYPIAKRYLAEWEVHAAHAEQY